MPKGERDVVEPFEQTSPREVVEDEGHANAGRLDRPALDIDRESLPVSWDADFLLGQTQKWTALVKPEYGGRQKLPQFFVQDDYKLKPNLTVNVGLRYQIQTGWSEVKGNERSFDPTVPNPGTGTLGALVAEHLITRHGVRRLLLTSRAWLRGFAMESGGFGLYVGALALAPLALVHRGLGRAANRRVWGHHAGGDPAGPAGSGRDVTA